jgi:N-acyl-D-amino-acid deacylase
MKSMTKVEAIPLVTLKTALPWDWDHLPRDTSTAWTAQPKSLNVLPYVGLNPLLIAVDGLRGRQVRAHADRGRARRDGAPAERGDGRRRLRLLAQCSGHARRAARPDTVGGAAQNDFDGTPLPTDVMWPETRMRLAEVLGERGEGFIALSMGLTPPPEWEALAAASGAPDPVAGRDALRRRDGRRDPHATCSTGSTRCHDAASGSTARASRRTRR